MDDKAERKQQTLKLWLLVAGVVVFLVAMGLVVAEEGFTSGSIASLAVAGLAMVAVVVAGAAVIQRGFPKLPAAYRGQFREREQWERWYACLYVWPIFMTVFAGQGVIQAIQWMGGDHALYRLASMGLAPLMSWVFLTQITGEKGRPGTPLRRRYERLNDELSVVHLGQAHRLGLRVALGGLVAVLVIALLVPEAAPLAVIVAIWAAVVATSVRFGLLQRAAEPAPEGEEG